MCNKKDATWENKQKLKDRQITDKNTNIHCNTYKNDADKQES